MCRICEVCGKHIHEGMTDENNMYCCEEHFAEYMDGEYGVGNWKEVEDDGCGGYYKVLLDGEWVGTGIYWTTWDDEE